MKRPLFFIIGAVTIIILLAVWIYVLFFSSPQSSPDTFTDLELGNTTDLTYVETDTTKVSEEPVVDVTSPERLRQLTTRPTVGYQEVQATPSSTPAAFYIESGTGHVYSINLSTGEEKRVSATTIPSSRVGAISPNGRFVMIQSGVGARSSVIAGIISTSSESISVTPLDGHILSFSTTADNTFLIAIQNQSSVVAKEYFPTTNESKTLFTVPFREATISWGREADSSHYVYPKASSQLEGFLYEVKEGQLNRLPIDGFGLTASGNNEGVLFSRQSENVYRSYIYSNNQETTPTGINFLTEKCSALATNPSGLFCGGSHTTLNHDIPDAWYKGAVQYSDSLWEVDASTGIIVLLSSMTKESGRQIDIANIATNQKDSRVYFINKLDESLWLYERTLPNTNGLNE